MIRGMEIKDLPAVRIAGEALAAKMYPELIPDVGREHELLKSLCSDTRQYARVIGEVGDPDAVLIARTGDNIWALRRHATVMMWHSVKPGAGFALLRDFVKWVDGQKHVAVAGFIDDFGMDVRMVAVLRRAGFVQRGGAYMYFGGSK